MAAVAPIETDQAAAAAAAAAIDDDNARLPAKLLDPQLLMAARHGDRKRLKELLGLKKDDDDDESGMLQVPKAAAAKEVVVEVDRRLPPPAAVAGAAQPTLPLLHVHGVTAAEWDSLLHVVAASGDSQEFLDCATMIHDQVSKGLLGARNNKGDTPLHCAAGAGNAHMISRLVALVTGDEAAAKAFLRLENDLGETALHHAVRAANMPAIDQLLSLDSDLACRCSSIIPHDGGERQAAAAAAAACSPFYLAVSLGEISIARRLFDASSSRSKRKLSYYSGPNERNALHAAVSRQALVELLEWFKDGVVDIEEGDDRVVSVPLVSHLTNQRDKDSGSTPLHLAVAASFPFQNLGRETRLLLDANKSTAYQPDNKGVYPIHVAAWSGRLDVVEMLLKRCPKCATLRDAKGRTFLHITIMRKKSNVVKYVCRQSDSQAELSSILNAQDINGDTPLHRAVDVGDIDVFNCLLENPRVRLDVANKEAMTPVDLSITKIPSQFHYALNPRGQIQVTLILMQAQYGENRADLFLEKHGHQGESEDKLSEKLTGATQVLGVVSVLIATVTFASAFTLPGGNRSDGNPPVSSAGTPVFAGTYAFDAFILADVIAFICSSLATFSLLYAGMPSVDLPSRFWYINVAALLLMNSARTLVVAFALGLYVVLLPVAPRVAIIVCAITLASLLLGHKELRRMMSAARMVWARYGTSRIPLSHVFLALLLVLAHFWSFLIIFGVPAIRNRK